MAFGLVPQKTGRRKECIMFPLAVFRTGKNLIAVRVEDTGGGGGFYGDSSAVYLKTENGILPSRAITGIFVLQKLGETVVV